MNPTNRGDVRSFLSRVFGRCAPGSGLIEVNWDERDEGGVWKLNRWKRFKVEAIDAAVDQIVKASDGGARVYIGAGLRRPDLKQRERSTSNDIVAWPALVWDFDNQEVAEAGLAKAEEIDLGFQLVVQTGALRNGGETDLRVQCWALLDEPLTDMSEVNSLLRAGISVLGSDKSIHDARRVMRAGGSVAWARKDGRVDEPTLLRDDLETIRTYWKADELREIFGAAEPLAPRVVDTEQVARIRETLAQSGAMATIWRGAPEADSLIADLLEGVEMNPSIFRLAHLACRAGHDAATVEAHLRALVEASAAQASRPDRAAELEDQLADIVRRAAADAGAAGNAPPAPAVEEFTGAPEVDVEPDDRQIMFHRYIWVEELELIYDTLRRLLMTRTQFNLAEAIIGPPTSTRNCAWHVFSSSTSTDHPTSPGNRRSAQSVTYQPGQTEVLPGPYGALVNMWVPSDLVPDAGATDDDIRPWLNHASYVCGAHVDHFLDYMAYLLQRPGDKINHAILIKSRAHGVGKGILMEPIVAGLGRHNTKEIGPNDVASQFNSWCDKTKLVIVEEMHAYDRKDTMQKLKGLITAPPREIRINQKNQREYSIPNILSMIFFSNMDVPVLLEPGDRRFWVVDSDVQPMPGIYYDRLADWYAVGGSEKVCGWLMKRDISSFSAKGHAPVTEAKLEMIEQARPELDAWVADGIAAREGIWDRDFVTLGELLPFAPELARGQRVTEMRLSLAMKAARAKPVTAKVWLKDLENSRKVWALRPTAAIENRSDEMNVKAWANDYAANKARGLNREFKV
jgi:hypothetical protein